LGNQKEPLEGVLRLYAISALINDIFFTKNMSIMDIILSVTGVALALAVLSWVLQQKGEPSGGFL
jgi:hypothetical protein